MSDDNQENKETEDLGISGPTEGRKRARFVKALDKLIEDMLVRGEADLSSIKPREIPYNLNMLIATREKLVERTPPASAEQQAGAVNGLTREQALELVNGHRAPNQEK